MTAKPLTSGEQAKVFMFIMIMIPSVLLLAGIIPAIFLLFGMHLLKKNRDFSAIETSVKYVVGYLWVCLVASIIGFIGYLIQYLDNDWYFHGVAAYFLLIVIAGVYMLAVKRLYLSPLRNHSDWVKDNQIFSHSPSGNGQPIKNAEIGIINVEKDKSYSVADELSKWAKLRDEGVVSEAEFQEARSKILKSL